ncbi:hypothetical protein Tco_1189884, partial [Tanacetum coccineum]
VIEQVAARSGMDSKMVELNTLDYLPLLFCKNGGVTIHELILEFFSTFRLKEVVLDLDTAGTLQFQLGGVRHCISWREFILALGLHIGEEMETTKFGLYWTESGRQISDKGDLSAY